MDRFNQLLNEVAARKADKNTQDTKAQRGAREVRVTYMPGNEVRARIVGDDVTTGDAAALLYAAGRVLGKELDIDAKMMGDGFIDTAIEMVTLDGLTTLLELL